MTLWGHISRARALSFSLSLSLCPSRSLSISALLRRLKGLVSLSNAPNANRRFCQKAPKFARTYGSFLEETLYGDESLAAPTAS